jgi:hypothetical protein
MSAPRHIDVRKYLCIRVCNRMFNRIRIRIAICIRRLFGIYKSAGMLKNFGEMMKNIFKALFEVLLNQLALSLYLAYFNSCQAWSRIGKTRNIG